VVANDREVDAQAIDEAGDAGRTFLVVYRDDLEAVGGKALAQPLKVGYLFDAGPRN
jgi:hypothetical protein